MYNCDNPFSTVCTDTSLHSMYREICFPWNAIANERMVLESLLYGSRKLFETVKEFDDISIVTKCSRRFKKNEILCFIFGRSITKSASVEMDSFLLGLKWFLFITIFCSQLYEPYVLQGNNNIFVFNVVLEKRWGSCKKMYLFPTGFGFVELGCVPGSNVNKSAKGILKNNKQVKTFNIFIFKRPTWVHDYYKIMKMLWKYINQIRF